MKPPFETIEQARAHRYGEWGGNPEGRKYKEGNCAEEIHPPDMWHTRQCARANGYGPGGLYCKQHAKRYAASGKG